MYVSVDICKGLDQLHFNASPHDDIYLQIWDRIPPSIANISYLTHRNGKLFSNSHNNQEILDLQLNIRTCGGKGGFGSQLRAQGGKMAAARRRRQRASSRERAMEQDSFRTLDGRRMKSIRQAKELAEYLDKQPGIARSQRQDKIDKLRAIINNATAAADNTRFSDVGFLEESERTIDEIRDSVNAAMDSSGSSSSRSSSSSNGSKPDTPPLSDNETSTTTTTSVNKGKQPPKFAGFFDDGDDSDD